MLVLDERISRDLKSRQQQLEEEGKLPSQQQLAQYYQTFRDRFGPERLGNLDGTTLLDTMHGRGGRDSLVYWLEFKNDGEFLAIFGGISGGSAHKFGLFRRKETGIWTIGSPQKSEEISVEQAMEIAREQRNQLIAGADLLAKLPERADDASYQRLQQDMQRVAPALYDSGWAHKYFYLLYPEKLDDYHNVWYQGFHLIKLLQRPQSWRELYTNAGQYVAIAHALEMPINTLTSLLNIRNGNPYTSWLIGISRHRGSPGEHWETMRTGNFCAVDWKVDNLADIPSGNSGKEAISKQLQQVSPPLTSLQMKEIVRQLMNFKRIVPHDHVLASAGKTILGIGRVTGSYIYEPESDLPHRYPVEWLSLEAWDLPEDQPGVEGKSLSVYRLEGDGNFIETERRLLDAVSSGSTTLASQVTVSGVPRPAMVFPPLTDLQVRIQTILERKGQVILYGPPGTGKTYWAERTACELAARASVGKPFEQLAPDERATITGTGSDQVPSGRVRLCCFHPSYGYEDFLEGLRPRIDNGSMHFLPRDGIFKQLCQDARMAPQEKFYLIIDEINRGDIPRIFGELLTVLEKDKRDKAILLPLSNQPFQVPANVYLIGTMNTADRSIALLDAALRRRFGFIELLPDSTLLGDTLVGGVHIGLWLDELNRRICTFVGQDGRNLQIGHAYFLERGHSISDFTTFARVLQDDIVPLLEEYCYGDYVKLEQILGKDLVDGKTQQIRYELFDPAQQANLTQALLAMNPDITTSRRAARAEQRAEEEETEQEEQGS